MSETPRLYTSPGGRPMNLSRRGRRRRIGRFIAGALVLLLVWAFWISRDTHPVAEFVPSGHSIEAVLPHAAVARYRVAASRVWDGVPQTWIASAPEAIAANRGLPDWIVGNLIGGSAVVVANDVAAWSDAIFIARMTRAGCVIERALRFRPANDGEWAGGLYLRFWEPGNLHYAVRGRTLIASPSRDALVAALTLTPERRVPAESVKTALSDTGSEDARGTWTLPPDSELGRVVQEIRFAVRVDENEATVRLRATFQPEVAAALQPHWAELKPASLPPAIDGPLAISTELGANVEETWRALGEVVDVPWLSAEQWQAWRHEAEGQSAAALLTALLGPMGPSARVTWQGIDMDEMSPTPVLVGSLTGRREAAEAVLAALSSPNDGHKVAEAAVLFDAETGRVQAPLMSGPSMSPLGEWTGDVLYFSSSTAASQEFFDIGRARTRSIPKPANLYARMDPAACVQLLVRAGRELAQSGMLRGQTPESFEENAAVWTERAGVIEYVEGTATVTHLHLDADLLVQCRPRG